MSADHAFAFFGYMLRPTTDDDMSLAATWTTADADHAGRTSPEFWLEQKMNRDSYMLEDTEGDLFFFKIHRLSVQAVELHCQFPPVGDDAGLRQRVQDGIVCGFTWLEGQLKKTKVRDVFFESTHEPLRAFAVKRLGFTIQGDNHLTKKLGGA